MNTGRRSVQNQTEKEFTENLVSMIQNQDGVVEISDDEDDDNDGSEEETPSAAEMRKFFRLLALGLERTRFKKMDLHCDMKEEVDGHLRKTFHFIAQIFLCRINIEKILHFVHFYRCRGISAMVRCIFRKRRLLKPPRIKSKTGFP